MSVKAWNPEEERSPRESISSASCCAFEYRMSFSISSAGAGEKSVFCVFINRYSYNLLDVKGDFERIYFGECG